jgi:hypothetical protein
MKNRIELVREKNEQEKGKNWFEKKHWSIRKDGSWSYWDWKTIFLMPLIVVFWPPFAFIIMVIILFQLGVVL